MTRPLRVLSWGAGVQSTCVLLRSVVGDLPKLDAAVFADVGLGVEPREVYELLWQASEIAVAAGIPVYIVSKGDLRADILRAAKTGERVASIPAFTLSPTGKRGAVRRQCTAEMKIAPIQRALRSLLGYRPRQRIPDGAVEQIMGISSEEASRMKPSSVAWITNTYPLCDFPARGYKTMSRAACVRWMRENFPALTPAKSACVFCPYHSDSALRSLRDHHPDEWAAAVAFDKAFRHHPRLESELYLHKSCVPLDEVDLSTAEDEGQMAFSNFCEEGVCGV